MNIDHLFTLKRMNELIKRRATGSPKQFAKKLEISESSMYNQLHRLRAFFGAPITYDADSESYCYEEEGELILEFRKLSEQENNELNGAFNFKQKDSIFFDSKK